jgi:hypothetical protein
MAPTLATIKSVLKSQSHASLAMLGEAIQRCPDNIWLATDHKNEFWQISTTPYFSFTCTWSRMKRHFAPGSISRMTSSIRTGSLALQTQTVHCR